MNVKNKKIYVGINIVVLTGILVYIIKFWKDIFILDARYLAMAIMIFASIHFFRIIRQYVIFMEENMKISELIKLYLVSSLTNVILPYRIGELYKIYLYGYETGKYKKSAIAVIIDKFADSVFLLIAFITIEIVYNQRLSIITILLLIFVCFITITYITFENTYKFLNKYLIMNKKTEFGVKCLKFLEEIKDIFLDIKNMIKNRETLIILLTVLSWTAEIAFVFVISNLVNIDLNITNFIEYINNSFFGLQNSLSNYYINITIVAIIIYIVFIFISKICNKVRRN